MGNRDPWVRSVKFLIFFREGRCEMAGEGEAMESGRIISED